MTTRVILIGGAPGAGKTTLARSLAAALGWPALSTDHLNAAAQAVTTRRSHPPLHPIAQSPDFTSYYSNSSQDELRADAIAQHAALRPAIDRVIDQHVAWAGPLVLEGWALVPSWIAERERDGVRAVWLVTEEAVLRAREADNSEFYAEATDPERMRENFLARSVWFSKLVERQATESRMPIVRQDGTQSVEMLVATVRSSLAL